MRTFINVEDIGNLRQALAEAQEIKNDRFKYQHLGKNKTLMMIFFNNSLRTRLSTQKAAMNLGMNVIVLDVNAGAWKLETERGVIMDGDKSEHLLEAIPVMGCYCDMIGVRSFAGLTDREYDYAETVLNQFIKYSGKPVFAMETATVHPLQAFADLITIEEYWNRQEQAAHSQKPKVVLTWAPHCRALPQAVPNSFAQWMNAADVDFVITHPEGYELDPKFVGNARVEYDQRRAFEGADFIYAKNWSNPGVPTTARLRRKTCRGRLTLSTCRGPTTASSCTVCRFAGASSSPTMSSKAPTASSSLKLPTVRFPARWLSSACWRAYSINSGNTLTRLTSRRRSP